MAIKGISEVRRLPRIGKIRLGIKKTNGSGQEYPTAVDYFVVNEDASTPAAAMAAFREVYGDKPRELDIMFPVEDQEKFFPQYYRRYGKGTGLICKGDGEKALETIKDTGEMREIKCSGDECEWAQKNHCKPVGTLQFLLYKVPGLGIWQIDTTSFNSIVQLNSAIAFVRSLTENRIAMIPLKLVIRPKDVQVEGKKKTVWVLDIASDKLRLEELILTSRKSVAGILLPPIDMDTPPDDLYPASVIGEQPVTSQPTPAAAAPSDGERVHIPEVMPDDEESATWNDIVKAGQVLGFSKAGDVMPIFEKVTGNRASVLKRTAQEYAKVLAELNKMIAEQNAKYAETPEEDIPFGNPEEEIPFGEPAKQAVLPEFPG